MESTSDSDDEVRRVRARVMMRGGVALSCVAGAIQRIEAVDISTDVQPAVYVSQMRKLGHAHDMTCARHH